LRKGELGVERGERRVESWERRRGGVLDAPPDLGDGCADVGGGVLDAPLDPGR
jgi:hypothetical protein